MTFSGKIGCLSTVTGGQKKNMGTNMGILTDVEGGLVCCFLGQISQDHKQRGLGGEVIVFRTMRMCIPQEVQKVLFNKIEGSLEVIEQLFIIVPVCGDCIYSLVCANDLLLINKYLLPTLCHCDRI